MGFPTFVANGAMTLPLNYVLGRLGWPHRDLGYYLLLGLFVWPLGSVWIEIADQLYRFLGL